MKRISVSSVQHRWWRLVAFASVAGGLAEIAWVSFYGVLSSTNMGEVARQVTVSFSHEPGEMQLAAPLGILIHLTLALLVTSLAAAPYPAWRAARLDPVRALHRA